MSENPGHVCHKCIHWVQGICAVTKERKNDTICNCGQFREKNV